MFYFPHFSTMYKNDVIIEFLTYTIKHNIPKIKSSIYDYTPNFVLKNL